MFRYTIIGPSHVCREVGEVGGGGGGECQEEGRGWQKDPEDTQTDNSFGTNLITTTLQYKEPIDCQLLVVCIGTKDIQLQPLVANQ